MRIIYISIMLCYPFLMKAQSEKEVIAQKVDSMAMVSRERADMVLAHFDTLHAAKLLYSLVDRYYYLIIKDTLYYKEYSITLDSLGKIDKICLVQDKAKNKKQRRQQEQYRKLLAEAEPLFDFSRYQTNYITRLPDSGRSEGRSTYFVIKDISGRRYGEYHLSTFNNPSPIHKSLMIYLFKRISQESSKGTKCKH